MSYCPNCGRFIEDSFEFCPECGLKVGSSPDTYTQGGPRTAMKTCKKCGAEMPTDAFYCLECGEPFDDFEEGDSFEEVQDLVSHQFGKWKSKKVALRLCIFLGWIGAHKYYEGKIKTGIFYTLTFGGFIVGWIVDIVSLWFKPDPYLVK